MTADTSPVDTEMITHATVATGMTDMTAVMIDVEVNFLRPNHEVLS